MAKLFNLKKIILTAKGRKLVEYGSYKKYSAVLDLKTKAKIRGLWVKKMVLGWIYKNQIKSIYGGIVNFRHTKTIVIKLI